MALYTNLQQGKFLVAKTEKQKDGPKNRALYRPIRISLMIWMWHVNQALPS